MCLELDNLGLYARICAHLGKQSNVNENLTMAMDTLDKGSYL
mgnify:FL=1